MNKYEELCQTASDMNVEVVDYPFNSDKIKGLYCDGTIALKDNIDTVSEKSCILAEELGHHVLTYGNIINQDDSGNRKQELIARLWAYDKLVGLDGIIRAYEHHCFSWSEMADLLNITEEFLRDAVCCYREKYGICTKYNDYIIYFEPLGVFSHE